MGAARLPSPARAAWPSALSFVAGEGRGWGNIKLSFYCDTGPTVRDPWPVLFASHPVSLGLEAAD